MAELRGERVVIRPLAAADVPQIAVIQAQPSVARWWGQPDDAKLQGKAAGTDGCTVFVIELDGEVVGLIQYYEDAAIRAYEKAGFRPVGVMRQSERLPGGDWHDGLLMDLLADEL
jgi:aminoglycoside 6'-N-acetyltransferase